MTTFVLPTGLGAPKHSIESFAEYAAEYWGYQPGGSLEEIVAKAGGRIVVGSSGFEDGESGSIVAKALNDFTIYISRNTSRQRDRFTIAHELGHLTLHLGPILEANPGAVMRATRWVDDNDPEQQRAEWEANWFAAAFLMPKEKFTETYRNLGLQGTVDLFDVSESAATTRARTLSLT
ncbi:ImmA/IrrE family metallo-endopeptidase [Gemmobacter sp. 24YEA27]|uniref:ImmA/IrrE family metallo-endopeptidase n=1 Tax=Gemmobacter sp. 24YEA27 TaxID=3040672 RepID=UPI0024B358CC|nr:ImmA/IrrE family metallo-endopeptidase [Gemmobacter sp. 24YEA27]